MIKIPANFDGEKFAAKFNLSTLDFADVDGYLRCPSLPDLTDTDIADCVVDLKAIKIQQLWEQADAIAIAAFDQNSRVWAINVKLGGQAPQWQLERIAAIEAWLNSVWQGYYTAKNQVQAGNLDASLPDFGLCPYTFADLLAE